MRSVGWLLLPWLCAGCTANASTATANPPAAPCDLYAAGGTPCVAAHSMTRALYRKYDGPLYRLIQPRTNSSRDVGVSSAGGRADSAVHNAFCKDAVCTVERIYDQSPQGNHLAVERGPSFLSGPRGEQDRAVGFTDSRSRVMLGKDLLYAAYFAGAGGVAKGEKFVGQGYSNRTAVGTAVGDEAQTVYAVLSGKVFNGGCCFDYGNAERLFDHSSPYWGNGSMEAVYWGCGDLSPPLKCSPADPTGGPYVLADMEHMRGMMAGPMPPTPISPRDFVVAMVKGKPGHLAIKAGDGQREHSLEVIYDGPRPAGYEVMKKEGAIVLGIGGDNSPWGAGVFYEGAITKGYASNETDQAVLASVVAAGYSAGVGLKSDDSVTLAPVIDASSVTYRAPGMAAAERNVSGALSDMISVLDFGAKGSCLCEQLNKPMSASCCPDDDTAAFTAAIAASSSVIVPPGSYRIDSTVHIAGGTRLSLSGGASLMRTNLSSSSEPVVLLSGWYGCLTGSGQITTVNPAPAGVVKIGPATATRLYNVESNVVEGISIRGPGVSWSYAEPDKPVDAALNGSIGVSFDSNEASVGGATYQNTLKGVTILAVDVGVYLGVQVNGNQVSGVMMEAIGQSAYLLQGPNSENVLQGGFVAGHGGNTTVIKTRASWNPKTLKHEGTVRSLCFSLLLSSPCFL